MAHEVLTSKEGQPNSSIMTGVTVCDLDYEFKERQQMVRSPVEAWNASIAETAHLPNIEIQCEKLLDQSDWNSLQRPAGQYTGVHQPLSQRDIISSDPARAEAALADSLTALDFSAAIGADYYVIHLTQQDNWDNREGQLQRSLDQYARIAEHHRLQGYTHDLMVEVPLEFPKHPAGPEEILRSMQMAVEIHPDTCFVFDVAHYWHNRTMLLPDADPTTPFAADLQSILEQIEAQFPGRLKVFHLGASYVDTNTGIHETHGFPGTRRGEKTDPMRPLPFRSSPGEISGPSMNFENVLQVLHGYAQACKRPLHTVLEMIGPSEADRIRCANEINAFYRRNPKPARFAGKRRLVETVEDYYNHPGVATAIVAYLGHIANGTSVFALPDTSPEFRRHLDHSIASEYVIASNLNIFAQKYGRTPARSIKPSELPGVLRHDPVTEIYQSTWQVDAPDQEHLPLEERRPVRTLFSWDIEHYSRTFPGFVLLDQLAAFQQLEPVYEIMHDELQRYGIESTIVMTGRGYHFVSQVPHNSAVFEQLVRVGNKIEPAVADFQRSIPDRSKRDRPIPPLTELANKGAARLQQYLFNRVFRQSQDRTSLPVTISDSREEGISLDNTAMVRHSGTNTLGTLGSIYLKPWLKAHYFGQDIVQQTRLLTRVPRSVNGQEVASLADLIRIRQNYRLSAELLDETGGSIPDASVGIERLISDYDKSDLKRLHNALDEEPGDRPETWEFTYRNYGAIAGDDSGLQYAFINGNDALLRPEVLDYVLNRLFDQWGGQNNLRVAGHVRTWLQSAYEDPWFDWGNRFMRHNLAARHATGWTELLLGQRFLDK